MQRGNILEDVEFIDNLFQTPAAKRISEKYKTINVNSIEQKAVDLDTFLFDKDFVGLEKVSSRQARFLLASENDIPEDAFEVTLDNGSIIKIKPGTAVKLKSGVLQLIELLKTGDEVDI